MWWLAIAAWLGLAIYGLCIFYHWLYWNGDILQARKKEDIIDGD